MTTRQERGLQGFADGQADGFMWGYMEKTYKMKIFKQKIIRTPNRIRSSHYSRLAQRKGFEPLYELPHNMISNHARSTAPPSLQQPIYYNAFDYKKQVFLPMFSFLF